MSMAYSSAKHSAHAWEQQHQADGLAAATVHCFAEVSRATDHATWLVELDACQEKANGTLSPMRFEDEPSAMACLATSEDDTPCQEEISASAASAGLDADLSREVVAGVSLMQEGIERATVAIPKDVHEAFFGALATPVALVVVLLTFLTLMMRCFGLIRARSAESKQLQADALCISSQTPAASAESFDDAFLCQELIVPMRSKCSISVPRLGLEEGALRSALVTDKMGQSLFKASLSVADQEHAEQLMLMRQDGTVLATCSLALPLGKSRGRCDIMRRDGSLFASLDWHERRVTWFSWFSAASKHDKSAFVLKGAVAKAWHLRVEDKDAAGVQERWLVDELRRPVARVNAKLDALQIEVSSETTADLGLVTATLLAVDRLVSVSSA